MSVAFRVIAVSLMVTFLAAGPGAPLVAAQQPAPPDTFKETMADQPAREGEVRFDDTFYEVAAGVATGFLVPGRVLTCAMGGSISLLVLVLTFGTQYRAATGVLEEGCGGKWVVKAEDLAPTSASSTTPEKRY